MRYVLIIVSFLAHCNAYVQSLPAFKPLRYDEDYAWLKDDTLADWYKRTKFFPVSANRQTYISYGGEARAQYFYTKNEQWGDAPEDKDGYVLSRYLVHADIHAGEHFRTFLQLQSSLAGSRLDASPVDDNALELHQAFADVSVKPATNATVTFRLGRQEFLYGSQRLISVREGPNNRQSFDAIKAILHAGDQKLDVFYGHYVAAKKGIFNDGFNSNTRLWGAYLVRNRLAVVKNMDIYYLGLWKHESKFDDGEGKEIRHSIGTRIWRNDGNWKYDLEALYQFGKLADKTVSAWTASINTSYAFSDTKLKPEIGLKTELISGDRSYDDQKLQTFNPLFPRGAYFGLAALIGPSNLVDVHPSLTLQPFSKLAVGVDYDLFWRYSRNDGLYGVNGALIYPGRNIAHKFIGGQAAINLSYDVNDFLNLTTEFTWFDAGSYLKSAGAGKDILFTGITTQLKF